MVAAIAEIFAGRRLSRLKNLFVARDLPDSVRRRIELAVAVAQEHLLTTHVRHALALVRVTGDRVSYGQAVGIYTRVLGLSEDEARVVTTRALAALGEQAAADDWPELPAEPPPEERTVRRRTLLDVVRHRLRGRVDEDMRRRVEFAAARAEVALLDTHIANALEFLDILEKEMPATDAVELYLDALEVREGITEVVYYKALAQLADTPMPDAVPQTPNAPPPPRKDEPRLRVVERDGA
jgi:hypothetical protein